MSIVNQVYEYLIRDEEGNNLGEYTSTDFPPFKGNIIRLNNIPNHEYAEVVGVVWMPSRETNTVVLKVKPSNRARL